MSDIKLSVCMVTYNHADYIAQAVESALAQRVNFPIEIVVGEDCSTDDTADILRRIAQKAPDIVRLRLATTNQGAKSNFLSTIADCHGQYVALLEGDDYWTCPDKLQKQVDALDARPEWAMCFHPTACIWETEYPGQDVYPLNWTKAEATIEDLFKANFIPTNSVVFRNRLFGEFPPWFQELNVGDWQLHVLNAVHGRIGFLPEVMSAYRIHRNGIWSSETPSARTAAIFRMLSVLDHHFEGKYTAEIDQYRLGEVEGLRSEVLSMRQQLTNDIEVLRSAQHQLQCAWNQLVSDYAYLRAAHDAAITSRDALANRNRKLQSFYDNWRHSVTYRVARKASRRIGKLRKRVSRLTTRATAKVSAEDNRSKAA